MGKLTPVEAVLGGVVLYMASDPRIRDMFEVNDEEHFVEGCHEPWFTQLYTEALLAVREATS